MTRKSKIAYWASQIEIHSRAIELMEKRSEMYDDALLRIKQDECFIKLCRAEIKRLRRPFPDFKPENVLLDALHGKQGPDTQHAAIEWLQEQPKTAPLADAYLTYREKGGKYNVGDCSWVASWDAASA